jgi:hypothetical protein
LDIERQQYRNRRRPLAVLAAAAESLERKV